jgi:hydroxymethylpyrimidine/phosphomethylpyrimidine kinase
MHLAVIKIGMLGRAGIIQAVGAALADLASVPVVLDPVMISKAGSSLLEDDAINALMGLLPRGTVLTPNRHEAARLTHKPCETINGGKVAAQELHSRFGCEAVLVTGFTQGEEAVDVYFDGMRLLELRGVLGPSDATHGSGCTLSAAIAGYLALGRTMMDAVAEAKQFTTTAIHGAHRLGRGPAPVNQFARRPEVAADDAPIVETPGERQQSPR